MKSPVSKLACPCCGYMVISDEYDICPICCWQYDDYQNVNVDDNNGPNHVSLREAQIRFSNKRPIEDGMKGREPYPDEHREPAWHPIQ